MNDILDKLVIRIVFTLFVCLVLIAVKYLHQWLNTAGGALITKKFYPTKNPAATLHFLSRIVGVGLLLSSYQFDISDGLMMALIDFLVQAFLGTAFYLASLYIMESIVLVNFEYEEEISKKKNLSYAIISCAISLSMALIFKSILKISQSSAVILFFLSLFSTVLMGLAAKSFPLFTKMPLNLLIIKKNLGPASSFIGHIFGTSCIVIGAIGQNLSNLQFYSLNVLLKIVLAFIIFPIIRMAIIYIFKFQDLTSLRESLRFTAPTEIGQNEEESLGQGIYEGALFFTSCYLSSVITGQINFGINYPVF